jgi:rubrerythrin
MAKEYAQQNKECQSELHTQHLCYFISQGFHLSNKKEYMELVETPKFICKKCGHTAKSDKNLCNPVKL